MDAASPAKNRVSALLKAAQIRIPSACMEEIEYSAWYFRISRLLEYVAAEKKMGNYLKALEKLGNVKLLILDDLGSNVLTAEQRQIFFEVIEERYPRASTLLGSQLPVDKWYEVFEDPTTADAIRDRLFHKAVKIQLKGDSMRKKQAHTRPVQPKYAQGLIEARRRACLATSPSTANPSTCWLS